MDGAETPGGEAGDASRLQPPPSLNLWPADCVDLDAYWSAWCRIQCRFRERLSAHAIDPGEAEHLAGIYLPLAAWVQSQRQVGDRPLILGINGAQGSGKSTLTDFLALTLDTVYGNRVASLSLDDLYLTRAERQGLAREIHPLFATRGVPGTHDTALGLSVLAALQTAQADDETALPSFDKARDDRRPVAEWPRFCGRPDIILFEGWCVGTRPQSPGALESPVNPLEAQEDPDGSWRRYVNAQLEGPYAELYSLLERLVFLKVPDLAKVFEWRKLQEQKLRARTTVAAGVGLLDDAGIRRFIQHFERLTRHNLEDLPARADLTLELDHAHRFTAVHLHHQSCRPRTHLS